MQNIGMYLSVSDNNVIGADGRIPWPEFPEETAWFKQIAKDKIIVCGSTTYINHGGMEPIGDEVLVVLSSNASKLPAGYDLCCAGDTDDILKELAIKYPEKDILFVGGMEVFNKVLPWCHDIYVAKFDMNVQGDTIIKADLLWYLNTCSAIEYQEEASIKDAGIKLLKTHYKRSIH